MKKNQKDNPKDSPKIFSGVIQHAPDSTLVNLTREFESLTSAIAELEKHSDNEQTLLLEAKAIYGAVEKRTREVLSMNCRTLRVRQIQLANVKEMLYDLTRSPGDCNSCEPMTSSQANRKGW